LTAKSLRAIEIRKSPKVFIDADVLFAGSAAPSEHGASLVVLRMAEITLLEAYVSQQIMTEVERNLATRRYSCCTRAIFSCVCAICWQG